MCQNEIKTILCTMLVGIKIQKAAISRSHLGLPFVDPKELLPISSMFIPWFRPNLSNAVMVWHRCSWIRTCWSISVSSTSRSRSHQLCWWHWWGFRAADPRGSSQAGHSWQKKIDTYIYNTLVLQKTFQSVPPNTTPNTNTSQNPFGFAG
jgi:hypothetical protein